MHNLKTAIKDSRLWIQCLLTVLGTVVLALSLNGALASPTTLGDPAGPTGIQAAVVGASQSLREVQG